MLRFLGADLLNGTPIYDIKPYLPYADSFPDAKSGFASSVPKRTEVEFSCSVPGGISDEMLADIRELLKQDPRPAYQRDPGRIYGMKSVSYTHLDVYKRQAQHCFSDGRVPYGYSHISVVSCHMVYNSRSTAFMLSVHNEE